ncbi:hypothetical protein [Actinomadura sp. 9N215]|uniref:hypothetical protein n=1 Tax=Actinomadura sp. 9N215 TaxID=3375150 RepID=UPI00379F13BF
MALTGQNDLIGRCGDLARSYHVEWDETVDSPLYTARRLRVPPGREAGRRKAAAAGDESAATSSPLPNP